MAARVKEIISFMDLNTTHPAEALPRHPQSPFPDLESEKSVASADEKEFAIPKLHRLAKKVMLIDPHHQYEFESPSDVDPLMGYCIKIVCISDTLGSRVSVPDGDVLIHAGNLTQHGSFAEVQSMLDWLNSLPHRHKILVAGNRDMVLDQVYCNLLRHEGFHERDAEDLDFGSVQYLQDEKHVFDVWVKAPAYDGFSTSSETSEDSAPLTAYQHRRFTVFGTPWTSSPNFTSVRFFAHSAFQTDSNHLVWTKVHDNRIPKDTNILVAHGPPRFHGDSPANPGSISLLREVQRIKPWLVITGHHKGNEPSDKPLVETVVLDKTRISYERILEKNPASFSGWARLVGMSCRVLTIAAALKTERAIRKMLKRRMVLKMENLTTFVNAAVDLDRYKQGADGMSAGKVFYMKPEHEVEW
jgi:Calcineurin-like phosphoesterase